MKYFKSALMTDPKGKSEFCFPETLNVHWNIEISGKQNSLFPARTSNDTVIKYFASQLKTRKKKKTAKNRLLDASWHTNLPRFQAGRPDHVRVEIKFKFSLGSQ